MANTLNLFRNGAVGFIDWLDRTASQPPGYRDRGINKCDCKQHARRNDKYSMAMNKGNEEVIRGVVRSASYVIV